MVISIHDESFQGLTHSFQSSADLLNDQNDPTRYVIKDEDRVNPNRKKEVNWDAKKLRKEKPRAYKTILRKALNEQDSDTWNETMDAIRAENNGKIIVLDLKKKIPHKKLEGFDFKNIEFRGTLFNKTWFIGCEFEGSSYDISKLSESKLTNQESVFENCTFQSCIMGIKPFRENLPITTKDNLGNTKSFLTSSDTDLNASLDLASQAADQYVQTRPVFDGATLSKVDRYQNGKKTQIEGLYKGGCEFIDCEMPEQAVQELTAQDAKGRQNFMVHLDDQKISDPKCNPYKFSENAKDLGNYYDPRGERKKIESPKKQKPNTCRRAMKRYKKWMAARPPKN